MADIDPVESTAQDLRNVARMEQIQACLASLLNGYQHRGFTGSVSLTCNLKEGFLMTNIKTSHEEHGHI